MYLERDSLSKATISIIGAISPIAMASMSKFKIQYMLLKHTQKSILEQIPNGFESKIPPLRLRHRYLFFVVDAA